SDRCAALHLFHRTIRVFVERFPESARPQRDRKSPSQAQGAIGIAESRRTGMGIQRSRSCPGAQVRTGKTFSLPGTIGPTRQNPGAINPPAQRPPTLIRPRVLRTPAQTPVRRIPLDIFLYGYILISWH